MIAANYSPRSHVPSRKDILLLNILRCEPPSYKFDYYSYGGLPRSVMNSLRDFSLEELLQNKDSRVVNVGSVSTGEEKNAHVMRYSSMGNVRSVIVNAYNNNSAERDHKFWLELPLAGIDGSQYTLDIVSLEVFRGGSEGVSVWQTGLFGRDANRDILYEERAVIKLPTDVRRVGMYAGLFGYILKEKPLFDHTLTGKIIDDPSQMKYLSTVLGLTKDAIPELGVVDRQNFRSESPRWARYLGGTLDQKLRVKVEDRIAGIMYELQMSVDPDSGLYAVDTFEGSNRSRLDNLSHEQAMTELCYRGNKYLDNMFGSVKKDRRLFEMTLNVRRFEYKYSTIVMDADGAPVVVSHWESGFAPNGNKLPSGQKRNFIQFYNSSPTPLVIDEGADFERGTDIKQMTRDIIDAIPKVTYGTGNNFVEDLAKYVPALAAKHPVLQ